MPKKYISAGYLLDKNGQPYAKDSEAHSNSVTGDTVGDPLKDTSGPALNIVMKLTAIISLVFGTAIKDYSSEDGGPFWLKHFGNLTDCFLSRRYDFTTLKRSPLEIRHGSARM